MSKRFELNEEESRLIEEARKIEVSVESEDINNEIVYLSKDSNLVEIPEALEDEYSKIKEFVLTGADQGIKLLTAKKLKEKVAFLKRISLEEEASFMIVDTEKILLSPDKMDKLENQIREKKSTIVLLKNFTKLMKKWDTPNKFIEKFLAILDSFKNDSDLRFIASIEIGNIETELEPELSHMLENIPNYYFCRA